MDNSSSKNWMQLKIPALSSNVGLARVSVASFAAECGFTLTEIDEFKIAVSEAISNVVLHAYPNREIGKVSLTARFQDNCIIVVISDSGSGIEDIDKAVETSFSTLDDRMGMGFTFIDSFSDEFEITSAPGEGTEITLRKFLRSSEQNDDNV